MSYHEIDIVTPVASDLPHESPSYLPRSSELMNKTQQSQMSSHTISTPISSPSLGLPDLSSAKPTDPIGDPPISPSVTSEHDVHPMQHLEHDNDSDEDDDDDLFNEHDNSDLLLPVHTPQTSQSPLPTPITTAPVTATVPITTPPKIEEPTSEKRIADTAFDQLPSPKRTKTEDHTKYEAVDVSDSLPIQHSSNSFLDRRNPPPGSTAALPKHQAKFALASLRSVKRLKDATPFLKPVDDVALNIPTYYVVIKNPMDLGTMEKKVMEGKYHSVSEFMADMELIVSNCVKFNGTDSFITNMATNIRASFEKHMNNMPAYELPASNSSSKPKKRAASAGTKTQHAAAPKPLPPKESLDSPKKVTAATTTTTAPSSKEANPPARSSSKPGKTSKNLGKEKSVDTDSRSFALHPSGVPTIRRDSSVGGRPKREIHPPKSKDLPYVDVKPRNKKNAAGLRFCGNFLTEIMRKKHENITFPFLQPVDPVALNCPSYFDIIKHPMDLSTIQHKYNTNQYETPEEFEDDFRLMLDNCYKFNPEDSPVYIMGTRLEAMFNNKWQKLPLAAPSPPPVMSESEEDSDFSDDELIKNDPAIKFLEQQLERMKRDLKKMKKEALQKAREARDIRKKSKKSKKIGSGAKRSGRAGSGSEGSSSYRRKSFAGSNGQASDSAPYVTYEMKEELSRMCQNLSEKKMRHVFKLIQEGMPNFNTDDQDEVELEIDQLDPATVLKLYDYVVKKNGSGPKRPRAYSSAGKQAQPAQSKRKSKSMSEAEQTRQIEELQRKLEQFDRIEAANAAGKPSIGDGSNVDNDQHEMIVSASGIGMASAGNAGHFSNESSDEDDDSSSSEEE